MQEKKPDILNGFDLVFNKPMHDMVVIEGEFY